MADFQVNGRNRGDLPGVLVQILLRELGRVADGQAGGWNGSRDPGVLVYTPSSVR